MTEKKTTVDDIIGLVDCEPTDSVEEVRKLRGREDNNFYWYKKYKEVLNENEQLKQELFEAEKDYLIETYFDNPIRRDDKIESLKKEFKERFGRDFE